MTHYRSLPAGIAMGAVLALAAPIANAGDCGFDIDFEDFDPELRYCGSDFELKVKYEIEFDYSSPDDRFVLVLRPSECGRAVVDAAGQPITFEVPLDCPKKWKGKDRDYEATVRFNLPASAVQCTDDFRVEGTIIRDGENAPLARKDERAKLKGDSYVEYGEPVAVGAPVIVEPSPPVVYVEPCPPPLVVARPVVVAQPRTVIVAGHFGSHYGYRPVAHHRVAVHRQRGW